MGNFLNYGRHVTIMAYFTVFGALFLASSIVYLIKIDNILSNEPGVECISGLMISSNTNSSTPETDDCVHVTDWKPLALTGIVYGCLCILLAFYKIWPIVKSIYFATRTNSSRATFRSAFGGKAMTRVGQFVFQEETEDGKSTSTCREFLLTCLMFLAVVSAWVTSVIVPGYIFLTILDKRLLRVVDEGLFLSTLALFVISLISFTAVCVSCVFMVFEDADLDITEADDDMNSDSDEPLKEKEQPQNEKGQPPQKPDEVLEVVVKKSEEDA